MQTLNFNAFIIPAYTINSTHVVSRTSLIHCGRITLIELACWASHMQVWSEIVASDNDNNGWTLVFEDDIDLEMLTSEILQSFPDDLWTEPDLIYLGYCGNPPGRMIYAGTYGYRVHQALNPSCTHAYAIRARTASKLISLLSFPERAVDDEIVRLANSHKILAFSIHPPLSLQQLKTPSNPSDVNPVQHTLWFRFKTWINLLLQRCKDVEKTDKLTHSALEKADFQRAEQWRINTENNLLKNRNISFLFSNDNH